MAPRRVMEGDGMIADLEGRIAAAFAEGATSDDVAAVLLETDEAACAAGEAAEQARAKALDPELSAPDLPAARHDMDDAAFGRDRLAAAAEAHAKKEDVGDGGNDRHGLTELGDWRRHHQKPEPERARGPHR